MAVRINRPPVNIREKLSELERPIGLNGSALMRTETPQEAYEILQCGRRNMIINGDMRIAQRGTSLSGLTATGAYLIDRIPFYVNTAGTWTYTQSFNAPPGFKYSARFECTTANTSLSSGSYLIPQYVWEGNDLQRLGWGTTAAKPLTLSFWCRSNKPGIYHAEIQIEGSKEISRRYTINQSNVWEYKTMTFDANTQFSISATNTYGGNIYFWLAAGSAYNSGTSLKTGWGDGTGDRAAGNVNLADAVGNYFEITGIQAEIGKIATPFEHRSYAEELALCQRYFQVIMNGQYRDAWITTVRSAGGTTTLSTPIKFSVAMRASPNIPVPTVTNLRVNGRYGDTALTGGTTAITDINERGFGLFVLNPTASGWTFNLGESLYINAETTTSNILTANAEL